MANKGPKGPRKTPREDWPSIWPRDVNGKLVKALTSANVPDELKPEIKDKFLISLGDTFNFGLSAAMVGVSRQTIWHWRKADPEFDAKVDDIWQRHLDLIESESLYRRAIDPDAPPVAASTAGIMILNAHRSEKYRPDKTPQLPSNITFNLVVGKPPQQNELPAKTNEPPIEGEIVETQDSPEN